MSGRTVKKLIAGAALVVLWGAFSPSQAYLKFGVQTPNGIRGVRWTHAIQYLVTNRDAIAALRDLVFKEGIFGGPSCGAVLVAAAREAVRMGSGTIVALLPDGGWKYLSAGTFTRDFEEMTDDLEGGVNWW